MVPKKIDSGGLVPALQELRDIISTGGTPSLELYHEGHVPRFKNEVEITIYRIVQELVNNAMKHANATQIRVYVKASEKNLVIEVSDNGKGLDPQTAHSDYGLSSLKPRIEACRGVLETIDIPDGGTCFRVTMVISELV